MVRNGKESTGKVTDLSAMLFHNFAIYGFGAHFRFRGLEPTVSKHLCYGQYHTSSIICHYLTVFFTDGVDTKSYCFVALAEAPRCKQLAQVCRAAVL